MALCVAFAFSVGSVEAQLCGRGDFCDRDRDGFFKDHKRCVGTLLCTGGDPDLIDCNDNFRSDDNTDCGGGDPEPEPDPLGSPIIAVVANKFRGGAAGYIAVNHFDGSYTNVSLNDFNRTSGADLRAEFDVLHIQWSTPSSLRVSWDKLEDFMLQGGGILFEDPQNVFEIEYLDVEGVEHHVAGDDVAIVEFEPLVEPLTCGATLPTTCYETPEEILSAFTARDPGGTPFNLGGYFRPVPTPPDDPSLEEFCLHPDNNPFSATVQTLGLGYGCLANNHMTFDDSQTGRVDALTPFLRLEGSPVGSPDGEAVGLYGEFGPGRILFTGPDSALHASFPASPLQANHYCLLTNELIWVSNLLVTNPNVARAAMDKCVQNAEEYRIEQGQLETPHDWPE